MLAVRRSLRSGCHSLRTLHVVTWQRRGTKTSQKLFHAKSSIPSNKHGYALRDSTSPRLLALDRLVDVHHEQLRSPEPDVPEHQEEPVADRPHVPEEKRRLHEPVHKTLIRQSNSPYVNKKMNSPAHVAPVEVIVEAVAVDEAPGAPAAEHRPPPPLVVLHRQLEVRQRDGDERGDDDKMMKTMNRML